MLYREGIRQARIKMGDFGLKDWKRGELETEVLEERHLWVTGAGSVALS